MKTADDPKFKNLHALSLHKTTTLKCLLQLIMNCFTVTKALKNIVNHPFRVFFRENYSETYFSVTSMKNGVS